MKNLFIVFTVALAISFTSCSEPKTHEVLGEVFLKTKSGVTMPQSLVRIYFFNKENFKKLDKVPVVSKHTVEKIEDLQTAIISLPLEKISCTSDKDGEFKIKLEKNKNYQVVALLERNTFNNEKEYFYWEKGFLLMDDNLDEKISLSNSGLYMNKTIAVKYWQSRIKAPEKK